jgi:hypothetical protein
MTYSITAGNSAGHFDINGTTGEITVSATGEGNLSGPYVLTRFDSTANTTQQITVNILADVTTVDATHPLTRTRGATTFSLPFDRRANCCEFADGSIGVKLETGLKLNTPTPVQAQRSVLGYNGIAATKWVDGSHLIRGRASWTGIQSLDERHGNFSTAGHPTYPLTLQAGDRLIFAKSLDDPGINAQSRWTCWHSGLILTVVDELPTEIVYRPALFGSETSFASAYIPQFDIADLPALATPTLLDMDGAAVTFDSAFNAGDRAEFNYDPLSAFGLQRFDDSPHSGYEGWQTTFDSCNNVSPANNFAYAWWVAPIMLFLRGRLSGASDALKHRAADMVAQHALDWRGLMQSERAAGISSFSPGGAHGGHHSLRGICQTLGAWVLDKAGATSEASDIYGLIYDDAPTIDGLTMVSDINRVHLINNKRINSGNRSTSSWHNWEIVVGTAATAPGTEIHLGTTNFYTGANRCYYESQGSDRIVGEILGATFKITERSGIDVTEPQIFRIVDTNFTRASYTGSGGDRWVVEPSFTKAGVTPPVSGDKITFVISDEELAWCTAKYSGDLVGHIGVSNYGTPWQEDYFEGRMKQSINDSYYALSTATMSVGFLALYGLTGGLWSGQAQTGITAVQTLGWAVERMRQLGTTPWSLFEGAISALETGNRAASLEALYRHYIHGDAGKRANTFYLGAVQTPLLSNATATETGETTADLSVDVSLSWTGTTYCVVTTSATPPSSAQIQAGQNHAGAAATFDDSVAVTAAGTKAFSATGLTAGTTYYAYFAHVDAENGSSAVASSGSFETESAGPTPLAEFLFAGGNDTSNDANTGSDTAYVFGWEGTETYTDALDANSVSRGWTPLMTDPRTTAPNIVRANAWRLKSQFTVEVWFRIVSGSGGGNPYLMNTPNWNARIVGADFWFSLTALGGTTHTITAAVSHSDNVWRKYKLRWNGTTGLMEVYVNDTLLVSGTHPTTAPTTTMTNTGDDLKFGWFFGGDVNGSLDDFKYWEEIV